MNIYVRNLFLALAFGGGLYAQCPSNGLVVVVNKVNPTEALTIAQLKRMLLGEERTWPDKKSVVLLAAQPQSPAFKCMLSAVAHMTDIEFTRYNAGAEFRGAEPVLIRVAVNGQSTAIIVSSISGSIAIVGAEDLPSMASSVRVVRINGKQFGEPGYPL